jgi:AraC family transcriptional regulator, regulatory protein of adaptative response / methylated-DNA-[protein]-cysteine methyltransferase
VPSLDDAPIFQTMRATAKTRPHEAAPESDERFWQAVVARDRTYDGTFYYSVASTGVYCRPSCAARLARRENVRFHATCRDAETAGFRPCKRCRPHQSQPDDTHASKIAAACRMIEAAEEPPSLAMLAEASGLSRFHFHRVFKAVTGITPRAYAAAHRRKRIRDSLHRNNTVTEAIHAAGFNSTSRFYTQSDAALGMAPSEFRAGGAGTEVRFAVGQCALGAILVAATPRGISAILLGDEPEALIRDLEDRFPNATLIGADPAFEDTVAKVVGFVEQPGLGLDLPLDVQGTAFQQRVWDALRQIPPGTTVSYAELANRIGKPAAVRAVASACAANKIAVAIPCHRVVRNDGALSGYRWGVERKRALLASEKKS